MKRLRTSVLSSLAILLLVAGCGSGNSTDGLDPGIEVMEDSLWHAKKAFLYERTAQRVVPGLGSKSIADRKAVIDVAIDALIKQIKHEPGITLMKGTNKMDRLDFPPVDLDMDGKVDEVGKKIEFSFRSDRSMVDWSDRARGIGLRWGIVVYSNGDNLDVVMSVPETFTSLYFRNTKHQHYFQWLARKNHWRMRYLVYRALHNKGYWTYLNHGIPGTEMNNATISKIESMMGPITAESMAPSLKLKGVKVKDVVAAVEKAFAAKRVPDLNGDGKVDAADETVLPNAMAQYMQGKMSFQQMSGMMNQGFGLWKYGYTFQQWATPRTIKLDKVLGRQYHIIELCQPYYAATALSTGLHHVPSMPCAIAVWKEKGRVRVNLLDPAFIFAYFYHDAGPAMPPAMQQLFSVFPTFVYNEMAGILNAAMSDLGLKDRLALHAFPVAK